MFEFQGVTTGYGQEDVLHEVTFTVPDGSVTTLLGPNGCGKTTLLRAAAGQLPLRAGSIRLYGKALESYDRKELARTVAFMPQVRSVPAITVGALIAHGRFPYLGFSRRMRGEDREAVQRAMAAVGVEAWAQRDLRALSGGERQKVYFAMCLAQDSQVLFLDEPTTYLDLSHQFEIMELTRQLKQAGKTVIMVLHDLGLALSYADQLAVMQSGRLVFAGSPQKVLESGCLEQVFRVRIQKGGLQKSGGYLFFPAGPKEEKDGEI